MRGACACFMLGGASANNPPEIGRRRPRLGKARGAVCVQSHLARPCLRPKSQNAPAPDAPPEQSLHSLRRRLCGQIEAPPQALHSLRRRLCGQIEAPPQALHSLRRRLCGQIEAPPQSLHVLRWRLCSQCQPFPVHFPICHSPFHLYL